MTRIIKFSIAVFTLLLVLVSLPFTGPGTRYTLELIERLTPLEISYRSGSLISKLEIERLRLLLDNVDIQLQGLSLDFELSCLVFSKVCLNSLQLERLDIQVIAGSDKSAVSDHDDQLYSFPVAVEANDIAIGQVAVKWASGGWSNGLVTGGVNISGTQVLVKDLLALGAHLRLGSTAVEFGDQAARIELPEINIPLELNLVGAVLDAPRWSFDDYAHQHTRIALDANWVNRSLNVSQVELLSEQWGNASLSGALEFLDDWPITVRGNALVLRPPVWQELHDLKLAFDVVGTLGDLVVNASAEGDTRYALSGEIDALDKYLPFGLTLEADWLGPRILQDLSITVASPIDLKLFSPWRIESQGTVIKQEFALAGRAAGIGYEQLKLNLSAVHEERQLDISSATVIDDNSASHLEANGTLTFAEDISWNLQLHSNGMNIPQLNEQLSGRLEGSTRTSGEFKGDGSWSVSFADMDLQGEINKTPAQMHGYGEFNSDFVLGPSEFEVIANSLELDVSAQQNVPPSISLEIADLSSWLPDSAGSLSLNSTVADSQRRFLFEGTARNVGLMDMQLPSATMKGYYHLDESQAFEFTASVDSLIYGDLALSAVQLALRGDESSQAVTVSSRGDIEGNMRLVGDAFSEPWTGRLLPTVLVTPAGQWQLPSPVDLSWDKNSAALKISDHCWQQVGDDTGGSACFADMFAGETVSGKGVLKLDLKLLDQMIAEDVSLEGVVDAAVELAWNSDTGVGGKATLAFSSGTWSRVIVEDDRASVSWDKASASVDFSVGEFELQGEVWRQGSRQADLSLRAPISGQGAIGGHIAFDKFGMGGVLKPLFPMMSRHSGILDGRLELAGTLETPLLKGQLKLVDGSASLVGNPTRLEQINLSVNAAGEYADLAGEFLLGGGATQITGRVNLQPEFSFDIAVNGQDQTLLWPPGIEATVSENLRLVMSGQEGLVITGLISVHDGLLEHEQLPEGSVDLSDDVVEVDYQRREIRERSAYSYAADVRVDIQDSFRVAGTGLEAMVGGDLTLRKKDSAPLEIFGELNIIEGKIDAFGQDLTIRRGNLSFVGEADNPDLNFRAERSIKDENVQVGVLVQGNLEEFSFQLYSSSPLSESEMMSYLIRGRGLDKGAVDGGSVALSLGLSAVNQTKAVRGLNNIPGLSGVGFATEGSANETAATVGGYVGNRIYLSYGVGLYEPINVLTTRFYILSRLWLEVVSSLESSADIYYSFDID